MFKFNIKPNFIIRLDDANSNMDIVKWKKLEDIFLKYNIKPIVGIIPHNLDLSLIKKETNINFENLIQKWHSFNWHIACHGTHHTYLSRSNSNINNEYFKLSLNNVLVKLNISNNFFSNIGIKTNIFFAPSHNYTTNLFKGLKFNNYNIISDGKYFRPVKKNGFIFIPQQFESFFYFPFGTWTFCLHPDLLDSNDFEKIENFISKYNIYFNDYLFDEDKLKNVNLFDYIFSFCLSFILKIKRYLL